MEKRCRCERVRASLLFFLFFFLFRWTHAHTHIHTAYTLNGRWTATAHTNVKYVHTLVAYRVYIRVNVSCLAHISNSYTKRAWCRRWRRWWRWQWRWWWRSTKPRNEAACALYVCPERIYLYFVCACDTRNFSVQVAGFFLSFFSHLFLPYRKKNYDKKKSIKIWF